MTTVTCLDIANQIADAFREPGMGPGKPHQPIVGHVEGPFQVGIDERILHLYHDGRFYVISIRSGF